MEFYEKFLAEHCHQLTPNHHQMVRAKARLVLAYSNPTTRTDLQRKVDLCRAVLAVLAVILPGAANKTQLDKQYSQLV